MLVKKALIITYYWPPSGGGGVQRWLKFVKYLREFGWEPIVYTPQNPDFELQDESLSEDIPEGITVLKQPIWEPFGAYRRLLGRKAVQQQGVVDKSESFFSRLAVWIRGNYFIPDARIFWVRPSANFLTKHLRRSPVDVMITTGPPHSIHLIGLELKQRLGLPWLADFRDPWSKWDVLDQLNLTQKSRRSHARMEYSVLTKADLVLTVSPSLEESLIELGAEKSKVITNGFDSEIDQATTHNYTKFRISHLGLLNKGRNPETLWRVIDDLCADDPEFAEKLEIYLAGTVENEVLSSLDSFENLANKVINAGYRTHDEVIEDYRKSSLLLLLINQTSNARWILPGKMFEYIGQGKPILSLGIPESDASKVLIEAGYSGCFKYDDYEDIKDLVVRAYDAFRSGESRNELSDLNKFHRKELTRTLAACLDTLK